MESRKQEVIQKLEEKGITIAEAAARIEFDPHLLSLYLAKDALPVPTRILDKLSGVVNS